MLSNMESFLESMPDDKVEVAIEKGRDSGHNLTMVGNWFLAESISGAIGKGYRQTVFTRYAPVIEERITIFDNHLSELLSRENSSAGSSRTRTIERLNKIICHIDSCSEGAEDKTHARM